MDVLRLAHQKNATELSIESQVITSNIPDDDHILVGARVTTKRGTFTGWAEGGRGHIVDIERSAVESALFRAGVAYEDDFSFAPTYDSQIVPLAEDDPKKTAVASLFRPTEGELGEDEASTEEFTCEKCGQPIKAYYGAALALSPDKVVEYTRDRHGKTLCASCSAEAVFSRRKRSSAN